MDYLQLFTSIIGLFPEIIVLVASILYVRKAAGVDALLMVVGSALTMVLSFGWLIPTIPGLNLFSQMAASRSTSACCPMAPPGLPCCSCRGCSCWC